MSKYIDYGKAYLILPTALKKWEYLNDLKEITPQRPYQKFFKWCAIVEKHESHRESKKPQQWYISILKEKFNLKQIY